MTPRKHIAFLHYSSPPVVGGVEKILLCHAQLLVHAGYRVSILAGRGGPAPSGIRLRVDPLLDSRTAEILEVKKALDRGVLPVGFSPLMDRIAGRLKEMTVGTDLLIAHNVCSLHKNLPLTAALHSIYPDAGFPQLILWHHDLAWASAQYARELHEGHPWNILRDPWPGAIHVTISEFRRIALARLNHLPAAEIRVIPNGLDVDAEFQLSPLVAALLPRELKAAEGPVFLLPVRVTRRKNIELAVRILAAIRGRQPSAHLLLTGMLGAHNPDNARYREELDDLIEQLGLRGKVIFLSDYAQDGLPDSALPELYRFADALLLPSREEGFGLPVLEAGLHRMPIFCADIPSLRELAGELAAYFPPDGDPARIAEEISNRLESEPLFQMRSRVRSRYGWEAIAGNMLLPLVKTSLRYGNNT